MAFEHQRLIQSSAGESATDQPGALTSYFYESATDGTGTGPGEQGEANYFIALKEQLRYGSIIQCVYRPPGFLGATHEMYVVSSASPESTIVALEAVHVPAPTPFYAVMAEAPLTYTTSGGNTDIVPFAASQVGYFATYSLNSSINDIGPPLAHSGIEFVECQNGQLLIDYSRPVVAGQTVLLWVQIRTASPSP